MPEDNINRETIAGNVHRIPNQGNQQGANLNIRVPLPVVISDEKGNPKEFIKLIRNISSRQEEINHRDKNFKRREEIRQIKSVDDSKKFRDENKAIEEKRHKENLENRTIDLQKLAHNLNVQEEKRSIVQRVFDIKNRHGLLAALTVGFPLAFTGKIIDKIKGGLRETVGLPFQLFGNLQGDLNKKLTADLESRTREREQIFKKMKGIEQIKLQDSLKNKSSENKEKALSQFEDTWSKTFESVFSKWERSFISRDSSRDKESSIKDLIRLLSSKESRSTKPTEAEDTYTEKCQNCRY